LIFANGRIGMSKYVGVFDATVSRASRWARKFHGEKCPYCLRKMRAPRGVKVTSIGDLYPSEDHVVPLSRGGQVTITVCVGCNGKKGDMMPDEFLETLQGCQRTSARLAMIPALRREVEIERLKEALPWSNSAIAYAFSRAETQLQKKQTSATRET
jgi:hypothetical protein